jgi:hypothetical protein
MADWSTPPAKGELTEDGQRYRLTWFPSSSIRKVALFRIVTDDRVALLQHVRTIRVQQRGRTGGDTDPDAGLEEIPAKLLAIVRDDGVEPAEEDPRDGGQPSGGGTAGEAVSG